MSESVTFQAILERGKLQEAVKLLMKLGRNRFGPAEPSVSTSIEQVTDLSRIEVLHERLHEVSSWNELLAVPEEGNGEK
jgi:hypothetical protein